MSQTRVEESLTAFKTKTTGLTVEERDAAVVDEVCRMTSSQLSAAYIYITGLTEDGRRNIIKLL